MAKMCNFYRRNSPNVNIRRMFTRTLAGPHKFSKSRPNIAQWFLELTDRGLCWITVVNIAVLPGV